MLSGDEEQQPLSTSHKPKDLITLDSAHLKLKPDEVLAVVNDMEELHKKLDHEEAQEILEAQRDEENEKVDLKMLQ